MGADQSKRAVDEADKVLDYYELLQVADDASDDEIKVCHKSPDEADVEEIVPQISSAWYPCVMRTPLTFVVATQSS